MPCDHFFTFVGRRRIEAWAAIASVLQGRTKNFCVIRLITTQQFLCLVSNATIQVYDTAEWFTGRLYSMIDDYIEYITDCQKVGDAFHYGIGLVCHQ